MRVIFFKDGAYKFITERDEKDIFGYSSKGKKGLKLAKDGTYISFDSISRIEDEEEFYQRNPEKRPRSIPDYSKLAPPPQQTYSQKHHQGRLKKMRGGFLRGVSKARNINRVEYKDLNEHQKEMYDKMDKAISSLEQTGSVSQFMVGKDD